MGKARSRHDKQLRHLLTAAITGSPEQSQPLGEWLAMATQLEHAGQPRAAEALLQQLVEQETGQQALKQLLRLYLANSWFYDAHVQLEALDPGRDDVELLSLRAVTALKLGRLQPALKLFQRAIKQMPASAQLMHGLGQCYWALGDRPRATRWYQRSLQRDPAFYGGYLSIAPTLDKKDIDAMAATIDERLVAHQMGNDDRAALEFARAKLAERCDDIERESQYLIAANALMSPPTVAQLDAGHRQELSAIERFIDKCPAIDRVDDSDLSTPILICSLPRSGSSLLENLLARSTEITPTGESGSLFAALRSLSRTTAEPPGNLLQASAIVHYRQQLLAAHQAVLATYAVESPFFTDKSMNNYQDIGRLLLLYPGTRVLWLQRDPRDTAISCFQHLFEGGAGNTYIYSLEAIAMQLRHVERCMTLWADAFPESIERVSYESLVTDSEAEIARLTDFIGVTAPSLSPSNDQQQAVLTSSALQVREAINNRAIGKAQRYPELVAQFDAAWQSRE